MCDFKPGDEVVCVDASPQWGVLPCPLNKGQSYTVISLVYGPCIDGSSIGVLVDVRSAHKLGSWSPSRFRKVERKNDSLSIEAFLTIKPGFEEPRRAPAKKRERV